MSDKSVDLPSFIGDEYVPRSQDEWEDVLNTRGVNRLKTRWRRSTRLGQKDAVARL